MLREHDQRKGAAKRGLLITMAWHGAIDFATLRVLNVFSFASSTE
jgi:hypothetical protein